MTYLTDDKPAIYLSHQSILGAFAKWIVRQSPLIENITPLLQIVRAECAAHRGMHQVAGFLDAGELKDFIHRLIFETPLKELNISAFNKRTGQEQKHAFVSRHFAPAADHDFVDLFALERNILLELKKELEDE